MRVNPARMLYEVYGNAFSYAFQGARLEVTGELKPAAFSLNTALNGELNYLMRLALRTTPLTWLGLLFSLPALFSPLLEKAVKSLIGYLALVAALFILMFGIAQGRDSPHYILTSFFCLDLIAGLGWGFGLAWLAERLPALRRKGVRAALLVLLVLAQVAVEIVPQAQWSGATRCEARE